MKHIIVKGQTVFVKTLDARAYNKDIREGIVSKVGNKYFYIEGFHTRFHNDTLFNDGGQYSSSYRVYLNKQDILDEEEFDKLTSKIKTIINSFGKPKLTLAQLRLVNAIISNPTTYEEQNNKTEGCKVM